MPTRHLRTAVTMFAALVLVSLAGCADGGPSESPPATTPDGVTAVTTGPHVRNKMVPDLCDRLVHDLLEHLMGAPVRVRNSQPPPQDRVMGCSFGAGRPDPQELSRSSVAGVDLRVEIYDSVETAIESRPDTPPRDTNGRIGGELPGLGDYAWFSFQEDRFEDHESGFFELHVQRGDALVFIRIIVHNEPAAIRRDQLEAVCRGYAETVLTLIRS